MLRCFSHSLGLRSSPLIEYIPSAISVADSWTYEEPLFQFFQSAADEQSSFPMCQYLDLNDPFLIDAPETPLVPDCAAAFPYGTDRLVVGIHLDETQLIDDRVPLLFVWKFLADPDEEATVVACSLDFSDNRAGLNGFPEGFPAGLLPIQEFYSMDDGLKIDPRSSDDDKNLDDLLEMLGSIETGYLLTPYLSRTSLDSFLTDPESVSLLPIADSEDDPPYYVRHDRMPFVWEPLPSGTYSLEIYTHSGFANSMAPVDREDSEALHTEKCLATDFLIEECRRLREGDLLWEEESGNEEGEGWENWISLDGMVVEPGWALHVGRMNFWGMVSTESSVSHEQLHENLLEISATELAKQGEDVIGFFLKGICYPEIEGEVAVKISVDLAGDFAGSDEFEESLKGCFRSGSSFDQDIVASDNFYHLGFPGHIVAPMGWADEPNVLFPAGNYTFEAVVLGDDDDDVLSVLAEREIVVPPEWCGILSRRIEDGVQTHIVGEDEKFELCFLNNDISSAELGSEDVEVVMAILHVENDDDGEPEIRVVGLEEVENPESAAHVSFNTLTPGAYLIALRSSIKATEETQEGQCLLFYCPNFQLELNGERSSEDVVPEIGVTDPLEVQLMCDFEIPNGIQICADVLKQSGNHDLPFKRFLLEEIEECVYGFTFCPWCDGGEGKYSVEVKAVTPQDSFVVGSASFEIVDVAKRSEKTDD